MIDFLFFRPVVNANSPIEPNTRVIQFDRDTVLTTCVPTPLPPNQLPNNPNWWLDQINQVDWEAMGISMEEWLEQFNLPEPFNLNAGTPQQKSVPKKKYNLSGNLEEIQKNTGLAFAPTMPPPCAVRSSRTFKAGERYFAKKGISTSSNSWPPSNNNVWVIDVNGLRYENAVFSPNVIELGSANQLRNRLQMFYLAIVLVVIAFIYRLFVK